MKKIVLFYITSITSVWLLSNLFRGFQLAKTVDVFLAAGVITIGLYGTQYMLKQLSKKSTLFFFIIGTFFNFFTIYLGQLLLKGFTVTSGSMISIDLIIFSTPTLKNLDTILTLLLAALIATLIGWVTVWSMGGSSKKES